MSKFQNPKQQPFTGPVPKFPSARPQTLDDLVEHGVFFADFHLRQVGRFPVTCFLIGNKGTIIFQPDSMRDDEAKERLALAIKLLCVAHAATSVVTVMEAWASFADPDHPLDPKEAPSEALNRREVVMVVGESREKRIQKCLSLVRTGNGGYFGLGEDLAPPGASMEGRFAPQFLPPIPPTSKQQRWAMKQLKELGLVGE